MIKTIIVKELPKPIRLDKYLKQGIKYISREKIIHYIRDRKIRIEGKNKIKPSYILKGKEKILLEIPDFSNSIKKQSFIKPQFLSPEPKILYEDKNLLIINKPSGIIVHPGINNIANPLRIILFLAI